ncbi:F-type H+-transporting ATPase subunit epsilon [Rhodovulum iodosum]|uniref:F-type H+-transporting ATPase subunit epsilon n=1 Tax=Rhodovulum iodosum TaxID=68291 RepID=A0ABV3XWS2_9RHOB|nr:F0F1 ATP synthase subunit epsilon [Rhodovulum robiginosum]RSK32232.1 F0F1 ATP synthase subunit epsilon [Rhodovulum robiginosum]
MRLTVLTPDERMFDAPVAKVLAEATNGAFALLPRHIDMTAPLQPGVLSYVTAEGETGHFGIDEGILVKCGADVSVAVRRAVRGRDMAEIRRRVAHEFVAVDEQEKVARSALARLEAGVVRRMLELERQR